MRENHSNGFISIKLIFLNKCELREVSKNQPLIGTESAINI
jgi:hypothetical protein